MCEGLLDTAAGPCDTRAIINPRRAPAPIDFYLKKRGLGVRKGDV